MSQPSLFNNKVAVSASSPLNCSTAGHQGNAERRTLEQRANQIVLEWSMTKPPQILGVLMCSIAREIREAVEAEREACAEIADKEAGKYQTIGDTKAIARKIRARIS